jgi:CheY-like chemotaxis protein
MYVDILCGLYAPISMAQKPLDMYMSGDMRSPVLRPHERSMSGDDVAHVAHELRAPLNTVLGIAEILANGALSPEQRGHVEMLQRAGSRLLAIMDQLGDLPSRAGRDAQGELTSHPATSAEHLGRPAGLAGLGFLVVDDSEESQAIIQGYLAGTGARLTFVETGAAALDALAHHVFHLVFMDLHLPDGSGLDVVRTLRFTEREHGVRPVPVVALSADVTASAISASLAAGCAAHLAKPLARRALLRAIATWHTPAARFPSPELRSRFLSQRASEVDAARASLGRGDFEHLASVGHRLQGTGASYGFPGMARLGKRLEAAADAKDGGAVDRLLTELAEALSEATARTSPPRAKALSGMRLRADRGVRGNHRR